MSPNWGLRLGLWGSISQLPSRRHNVTKRLLAHCCSSGCSFISLLYYRGCKKGLLIISYNNISPMPSIRKRVYGLIRTFSSPNQSADEAEGSGRSHPPSPLEENVPRQATSPSPSPPSAPSPEHQSFIHLYLNGRLKKPKHEEIYYGKTGVDLPILHIEPFISEVCASFTGPNGGLTQVPPVNPKKQSTVNIANLDDELDISFDSESAQDSPISPSRKSLYSDSLPPSLANSMHERFDWKYDWNSWEDRAYGLSTSLYECHPITKVHAGNPVADVFGILGRRNNCILALADGVNWGDRARLAARCAIRGAIDHLDENLFRTDKPVATTLDIFHILLGSFHSAHQLIIQEKGLLTTLCVTVVCQLKDRSEWVVCSCNVGDSLCFVYSQKSGVREVTLGSHDIKQMRDMRDAGGALGPVDGVNPELQNLTCAMTVIEENDLVFITSDGVSDNFDPVVGKFCVIKKEKENRMRSPDAERERSAPPVLAVNGLGQVQAYPIQKKTSVIDDGMMSPTMDSHLPKVEAHQRHELMLLRMEDLLRHGVTEGDATTQSAKQLCENLVNFATQLSMAKRRILEDPDLYHDPKLAKTDQRARRRMVRQKISEMPGKLDHATVVAYTVGLWPTKVPETEEDMLLSERTVLEESEDPEKTPTLCRKLANGYRENTVTLPDSPPLTPDSGGKSEASNPNEKFEFLSNQSTPRGTQDSSENDIKTEEKSGSVFDVEKVHNNSPNLRNLDQNCTEKETLTSNAIANSDSMESKNEDIFSPGIDVDLFPEIPKSPPPLVSEEGNSGSDGKFLRDLSEDVKMIDESSHSSSVSSGLHDSSVSSQLDDHLKENMVKEETDELSLTEIERQISGDWEETEKKTSMDRETGVSGLQSDEITMFAATVEESSETVEEIAEELDCSSGMLDLDKEDFQIQKEEEPAENIDTKGLKMGEMEKLSQQKRSSVSGVLFMSDLNSTETEECRGVFSDSRNPNPADGLSPNDVTTCASLEWDDDREFRSLPSFGLDASPQKIESNTTKPQTNQEAPNDSLMGSSENGCGPISPKTSSPSSSVRSPPSVTLNKELWPTEGNSSNSEVVVNFPSNVVRRRKSTEEPNSSSTMNESYYIATKGGSIFESHPDKLNKNNTSKISCESFAWNSDSAAEKKGHFSRGFERLESTLKRKKKHTRGSPTRHTVGVDAGWLRKLAGVGSGSRKSVGSACTEPEDFKLRLDSPIKEEEIKEAKIKSPRKGFPLLPLAATGKALRDRIRGLGSPLRATSEPKTVIVDTSPMSSRVNACPGKRSVVGLVLEEGSLGGETDLETRNATDPPAQFPQKICVKNDNLKKSAIGTAAIKRTSSESPNRERPWCVNYKLPLTQARSEADVHQIGMSLAGSSCVEFIHGQVGSKFKMRNRISSGSKVQSVV